ncbi:MAG: hypothetical protein OEY94_07915 [Alphaproteobacteria bacterium]|nr:hypothetical protein [Alphaproteobacteria bacterium]
MYKATKVVIFVGMLVLCAYVYSVVPVSAIEKTKPVSTENALFNSAKKKKSSGGSQSPPPLTALSGAGQSDKQDLESWPWPGYHKDGYKIYEDEPEQEEKVECLPSHRKKLAEINKGIDTFFEVGNMLKSQAGDVKNKGDLRKMVKKVDENQNALIGLDIPKYAKYYKACGVEVTDKNLFYIQTLIEGVHHH